MHVVSMNHTIVAPSDQAVLLNGKTALPQVANYRHPPGTILDIEDSEAHRLIGRGIVERYDPVVHGDNPAQRLAIRAHMASPPQQAHAGETLATIVQHVQ